MATRKLPDEPSFCFEVKPKHIKNRFQLLEICPREFREHNFERFGLNKEDITLSSNEHPQIFLDGLGDFFDWHKINVNDRVCFQVDSKVQSHLRVSINRHTAVSLVTTKIENTAHISQCTIVAATPTSATPLVGGRGSLLEDEDSMPQGRDLILGGGYIVAATPTSATPLVGGRDSLPEVEDSMLEGRDLIPGGGYFMARGGGSMPGGGYSLPKGGESMLGDGDSIFGGEDVMPGGGDSMSEGENSMSGSEDSMPRGGDFMPGGGDYMIEGRDPMLEGGDSMPRGGDFMPEGGDYMLEGGDPMPEGGDSMPTACRALALIEPIAPPIPSLTTQSSPLVVTPLVSLPVTLPLTSSLDIHPVMIPHLEVPLVGTPSVPLMPSASVSLMPSASTKTKIASRSRGKKRSMECHSNKAQHPQVRSHERTRLGSGVLRKINYCEDALLERSLKNANVNEDNLSEIQAHKKRVKAGCTLVQHWNLLQQGAEGATYDRSTQDVDEQLAVIIEKNPTSPLAIKYWMNQAFLDKYRRLLEASYRKDVLLINQFGVKLPVHWDPHPQVVDHTTSGWGAFVAANNLHDGDEVYLKVVHTTPIEFKFSFIRKSGSKPQGCGMVSLLKTKPKEKVALEGLERGYGSEGEATALDNRQHQYRSHFRFQADLSDDGKFHYSSDCPGTYARLSPYPKRSRSGKRFQPFKKCAQLPYKQSQPGTSFVLAPGLPVQEHIIQEFLKATPSTLLAEAKPKRGRPRKRA